MKRVAATSAYVRSWLPSVWKRALQRLLHFLLQLSMFPRRLLMLEGSGGRRAAADSAVPRRRWLRVAVDGEPTTNRVDGVSAIRDTASEDDVLFFAADVAQVSTGTRRGLANMGNTCFVNAVLQCLLAIPGFVDRLEDEVVRVIAHEQKDATAEPTRRDERQKGRHETHLRLAQTLLDLLKGLVPEEGVDEDGIIASADSMRPVQTNGTAAAHENGTGEARLPVAQESSVAMGKKRKRPMMTEPGDYSAAATTKRLKCFLQAASKCSDLVVAETRHQDQQDAEELLLFLLDSLHELLRWAPPSTPQQIKNGATDLQAVNGVSDAQTADLVELSRLAALENECLENLKKCVVTDPDTYNTTVAFLGDVRWHRYMKGNASFITEMLTGQIVRGSQCCSCANLTCLHQEFRVLSLSIDASKDVQTLGHCLDRYRGLEDLVEDNKVFCDGHCQDKTSRRTQVLLQRAPPALVIQLQRSKQTSWHASAEKIVASVEFPISERLNLTENMFLRDHSRPAHYELQAVCAHIGSALDAGHYIAYTRDKTDCSSSSLDNNQAQPGDRWYKFDDDFVTALDAATLRHETLKTAYMLFYTSVDPVVVEQVQAEAQQEQHQHKQNPIDHIEFESSPDRVEDYDNI